MDDTRLTLPPDGIRSPAEECAVVVLEGGRVVEHGGRALAPDGVQGQRLALRRPVEPPSEVNL